MSESKPQQTATSLEEIVAQLSLETRGIDCVVNTLSENVASLMASIAKQDEKSQECAKNTAPEFKTSLVGGAKCEPTPVQFGQINGISLSSDGTQADYPKPGEVGVSVDFNVEIAQPTNLVDALKMAEKLNQVECIERPTLLLELQRALGEMAQNEQLSYRCNNHTDVVAMLTIARESVVGLIAGALRLYLKLEQGNPSLSYQEIVGEISRQLGGIYADDLEEIAENRMDNVMKSLMKSLSGETGRPDTPTPTCQNPNCGCGDTPLRFG
ncbi:hypothetical protein N5J31_01445 [Acinetobacter johnsonii]|uniref:hypothetical protein n=1 Tax=Acinetobacter johnsonii TaxID=40214 RepID=UPI00244821C2|nr:hypothetical protein [Acinetobacter johnsonii]MDH2045590.1 hypothetical protein [Acinetobacter johnsonii]